MKRKRNLRFDDTQTSEHPRKRMKRAVNSWLSESFLRSIWIRDLPESHLHLPAFLRTTIESPDVVMMPPLAINTSSLILTETETLIFDFLLRVCAFHNRSDIVLRVAGGWVRDKVLGLESDDIDIALNNMTGAQFCQLLIQYEDSEGDLATPESEVETDGLLDEEDESVAETETETEGERHQPVGRKKRKRFAIIKMNPEQSKHLETATMNLFGQSIDFVNLRAEEYATATSVDAAGGPTPTMSRIPTMRFGTPEEDASRRDFTINALFYNINTREIEDITGRSIQHLSDRLMETPLPAIQTFLDDPLRILRAVRFASRLHFRVSEGVSLACRDPNVRAAIGLVPAHPHHDESDPSSVPGLGLVVESVGRGKVSRERVGVELKKMLLKWDPVGAVALIRDLAVSEFVFAVGRIPPREVPSVPAVPVPARHSRKKKKKAGGTEFVNYVPLRWSDREWGASLARMRVATEFVFRRNIQPSRDRLLLLFASVVAIPFFQFGKDADVLESLSETLVFGSLRWPRALAQSLPKSLRLAWLIFSEFFAGELPPSLEAMEQYFASIVRRNRLHLGQLLRSAGSEKMLRLAFLLAETFRVEPSETVPIADMERSVYLPDASFLLRTDVLLRVLETERLLGVIGMKPLLRGKRIAELLGVRPGPIIRQEINVLIDYQILHPDATEDEAAAFVSSRRDRDSVEEED